ncbi:hypothetical protein GIB67_022381 [Kingdonia uniflora]|uniref:Uncharacterized protein n=1 Tax=Kingdonia uniflora TaxID=39325 RepID=A0A7J7MTP6_9MAGN|nr:hypothetical protein GIB67_022381 [Kingdonia uniflora]
MLKRGSTSGTIWSGEVEGKAKKRRVDPSSELIGAKVVENRPGVEDELKAVEEMTRLVARNGEEEMNKMVTQKLEISELTVEAGKNLEEVVIQRDRLGRHLLKMGYSKTEVNDIIEDIYVEKGEVEDDGAGVERKDMRLIIKELENELAKKKDASASLLTSQAELQVELE